MIVCLHLLVGRHTKKLLGGSMLRSGLAVARLDVRSHLDGASCILTNEPRGSKVVTLTL